MSCAAAVHCCYLQSVRVEVWHRCPRSGAIAADGGSGIGQREVLLGAGAVPLLDVLRKPQVGCGCQQFLP